MYIDDRREEIRSFPIEDYNGGVFDHNGMIGLHIPKEQVIGAKRDGILLEVPERYQLVVWLKDERIDVLPNGTEITAPSASLVIEGDEE